jgi:hypothetical protein
MQISATMDAVREEARGYTGENAVLFASRSLDAIAGPAGETTSGSSEAVMHHLVKKLGIKLGQAICLLDANAEIAQLLRREAPPTLSFSAALEQMRYDIIMFWPNHLAGLPERFAELQRHIVPSGAIWAAIPKKRYARLRGLDFDWSDMQEAALQHTDLVDNKVVSLSDEEYATRFVIRKERRSSGT